jgi:hypothetical protein
MLSWKAISSFQADFTARTISSAHFALQYPADASGYGPLRSPRKFVSQNIDAVASPAIGGLVIG